MSRQHEIQLFIAQYAMSHFGNSPSIQRIADALGLSAVTVYNHLMRLVAHGKLLVIDSQWCLPDSKYLPPDHLLADLKTYQPQKQKCKNQKVKRSGYSSAFLKSLYKSQKGLCWWCSIQLDGVYRVDHRLALSKGGTNDPGNLCLTCIKCNADKSDKTPWEFNGRLL